MSNQESAITLGRIRTWADELHQYGLIESAPQQALLDAVSEAERGGLGQPQQPLLTVLLFGPSGVGKSQLLNALAGDVIARSHYERPTTRIPTVYAHADVDIERLFEYGTELGEMARQSANIIRHLREPLRNVVVVDAPDIDSYQREHREQVLRLLPMMDIVLYVVTAQTYLNDLGWQTVLKERGRRAFAFVINKWDHEGKRAAGSDIDIDTHFRALLRERAGYDDALIFRTSAEYWLHQRQNATGQAEAPSGSPPTGDQFPELESWLSGALTTSHVAEIQRRRRRALWGSVAEGVSQAMPQHLADRTWHDQTLAQLDALRVAGWRQIQPAVRMSAPELAHLSPLGRWPSSPGPFGLILRAGAGLQNAFSGLLRRGVPVQIGPLRSTINLLSAAESQTNTSVVMTDTTGLVTLADRAMTDVSLALRATQAPSIWLTQRLQGSVTTLPARLNDAMRAALAEATEKPYGRSHRIVGAVVLVLTELALVAVLGVAAYRLIYGYIFGPYVDAAFATNFFLLLGLIVLLGLLGLSASFPRPEMIVAKHLDKRLQQVWHAFIGELQGSTTDFAQATRRLQDMGQAIKESVNTELRVVSPRAGNPDDDDNDDPENDDDIDQLFGANKIS